jgi:hypothetical protein
MAIDNIARGLAASLLGQDGKVASEKMPTMPSIGDTSGFVPVGRLNDAKAVAGKTAEEILLMMLFGVVNPTFTDPKLSVALVSDDIAIIGRKCSIQGALSFDRGSITPAYGTSGYRAGLPTSYVVGGVEAPIRATSYDFAIDLIPTEGDNEIICEVKYAQGEQPVNSIGEAYGEPLAAGSVSTSFVIKGVYQPYLENGKEINFVYFDDIEDGGEGYQIMASSEGSGTKQSFMIHSA